MARLQQLETLHRPDFNALASSGRVASPPMVAVAMVRNEGDIIAPWLAHMCAVMDALYLVDHTSTDGTREFLLEQAQRRPNVHLLSYDGRGYFQAEITNQLARMASEDWPDAWLLALDADEFLSVPGQGPLRERIRAVPPDHVLRFSWRNCIPLALAEDAPFDLNTCCLVGPTPGAYCKLGIHASAYRHRGYRYEQGNHEIRIREGELLPVTMREDAGQIFHVPIRSLNHFAFKCVQGSLAYQALPPERRLAGQGVHWEEMVEGVTRRRATVLDQLREFAASYGEWTNGGAGRGRSIYALVHAGWECRTLPVVRGPEVPVIHRQRGFGDLAQEILAHYRASDLRRFAEIVHLGGAGLNREASARLLTCSAEARQFGPLPPLGAEGGAGLSESQMVARMVSLPFIAQENPTPSAWREHVPFLFFAFDLLRPRRFVELGSHYGNSFFAACQATKDLALETECVAVDTWQGDDHAGLYDESVFDEFGLILQRDYTEVGRYIRKTFAEASGQFAPGSIDLLHIDGLHTYEAVAEDFRTWLPKMSARGVVMFHDTRVFERGFGVWQLWAELKDRYPSFELEHGHGLGVLLVGAAPDPRVRDFVALLGDEHLLATARTFFSNLGPLAPLRAAASEPTTEPSGEAT